MSLGSWRVRRERQGLWKLKILSKIPSFVLTLILLGFFVFFGAVIFFAVQVPSPSDLVNREIAKSTKIYDKDGELLYDIYLNQNRTPIKLADVPENVKQATIAIEDKDFYSHSGFSILGIIRSFYEIIVTRQISGGGSTLTQQLVKNALLSGERTFTRKIKELILAIQVERAYTKDQILEMYLNEIPYGGTAYGIEAAANLYFGKSTKDLTLAEAALLAGLPQRPSVYSPYGTHPELSRTRQEQVLRRMVEDKYISEKEVLDAQGQQLSFRTKQTEQGFKAPHFVLYIKQKLIEQFGDKMVEQGGLKVTTTLNYKLQQAAEKIVKEEVEKLQGSKVGNGSTVILNAKTGGILAMVGSKDYFGQSSPEGCIEGKSCSFEPNVNAALSFRQPGSATKPITYAKALEKGYSANYTITDVKTPFPGGAEKPDYIPVNYDGRFHGPTQIRYTLGNSYNIPAVKMLAQVGVKDVMDLAYKMGVSSWEPTKENVNSVGLSLTLGGREVRLLDLISAFGVFANQGHQIDPVSILKVTDSKNKTLFEYKQSLPSVDGQPTEGRKVLDEGISFIISDILADNGARTAAFGANSVLNIPGKTVAVKTGTTDEKRDNWAIGFTPSYVIGVWVGNNDNTPMDPKIASGVTGASPIWSRITKEVLKGMPNESFSKPGKVAQVEVDALMSGKPHPGSPTRKEYFIGGTEPQNESSAYQNLKVCRSNPHRLANDDEDGENKDVIVLKESDPTGADKWQKAIEEWVLTSSDPKFVGSSKGCSGVPGFSVGGGILSIVNVSNGANVPKVFDVLAAVNSPNGVSKLTWKVDGVNKSTQTAEPFSLHVEFPSADGSSHTIEVILEDNNNETHSTAIEVKSSL